MLTRATHILRCRGARGVYFFSLPFPHAKKNLAPCFPRSCVRLLDHAGVTASWRSHLSVPTVQCVGDGSSSAGLTPSSPYASSARGVSESAESRAAVSTSPRTGCFELVSTHTHLPRRLLVIRSAAAPSSLFFGGAIDALSAFLLSPPPFFSPRAAAAAASQFLPYFFPSRSLRSAGRRSSYSPAPTSRRCLFFCAPASVARCHLCAHTARRCLREASAFRLFRVVRGAICRFRCRSNRLFKRPCRFRCEGGAAPSGSFREPLDVAPASRTWPTARILCSRRRASRVGSPIAWGCRGPT